MISTILTQMKTIKGRLFLEISTPFKESVYFYTLHKCASSLFAGYVLQNSGLKHVDYASQIYRNRSTVPFSFKNMGHLYGPIRISVGANWPQYNLVQTTTQSDFICNKKCIFLIRDPRDILVSEYYSFGYSHGLSANLAIRKKQLDLREEVRSLSIDEYVLRFAMKRKEDFIKIQYLLTVSGKSVLLRYEDMIDNFHEFIKGLTIYLNLSDDVIREIYLRTRPKEKEDTHSHRRSGFPRNYKKHLRQDTIDSLNEVFNTVLETFYYDLQVSND